MKQKLTVVSGHGRGRTIGVPTINCSIPEDFDLDHGIYAGWVSFNNKRYPSAIHYGPRPVFGESDISFEAHLLTPISSEIPKEVTVEIICFIRKIASFPSVEALTAQIETDVIKIRNILTPDTIG